MEEDTKYEKLARKLKEAQEERQIEVHNVYQAKQKLEELEEEFEAANKSHRVIKEEIADLKDQVLEGEKAAGEVEKAKHYLIKERDELQKMLRPVFKVIFKSYSKLFSRLHDCLFKMLETKCVGDCWKYETISIILVTIMQKMLPRF